MAYGGVTGAKAERLTLALELCKRLRTHLGFDEVQAFMQTANAAIAGKTPLNVLAEWPPRKARRALEPIMMAHLLLGARRAFGIEPHLET